MSSIKEKMKRMKRIKIKSDESFVIEIEHSGMPVAELVVSVDELTYEARDNKSDVEVRVFNPHFLSSAIKDRLDRTL